MHIKQLFLLGVIGAIKLAAASDIDSPISMTEQQPLLDKHGSLNHVMHAYVVLLATNTAFAVALV